MFRPFRFLHSHSGCFRLERLPGGVCTHWRAPPWHGAHPELTRRDVAQAAHVVHGGQVRDLRKRFPLSRAAVLQRGAQCLLQSCGREHDLACPRTGIARRERLRHDDTAGGNRLLNESPICKGLVPVVSTLWRRPLQCFHVAASSDTDDRRNVNLVRCRFPLILD